MISIRLRLFAILLATTGAVWLFAVVWTYSNTQAEVERVLDARLIEAARMVSSLITDHHIDVAAAVDAANARQPSSEFERVEGDYNRQLSCQIWSLQGTLVSRSESAPESTLVSAAVASAMPSMRPTDAIDRPSDTNSAGSRLCTSSEATSMSRLTKPSTSTARGSFPRGAGALRRARFDMRIAPRLVAIAPRRHARAAAARTTRI